MKLIQIVDGYRKGDGISNVAAAFDEFLKKAHYETFIYSRQLELEDLESDLFVGDTIVLYHFARLMDPLIKNLKCNKVLIFHNITEPELLAGTDEEERMRCAIGLYDAAKTAGYFDLSVAFSEYSRKCLLSLGWQAENIFVLPISVRLDHFSMEPSKEILKKYKGDSVNILFTGRIWPNKKQEDIIAAFAAYKELYHKNARLLLVGSISKGNYYPSLCAYAEKLGVAGDIIFSGHVTFEDYLAYYHVADMYLCMSEHEGFCIPLVEAMYFEVPIIAYASTAVPDTLAGCGILLDSKDPETVAKAINEIMVNRDYRKAVVDRQNIRLQQLMPEVLEERYIQLLKEIVNRLSVKDSVRVIVKDDKYRFSLVNDLFGQIDRLARCSGQCVIYGAGAAGKKLYLELKREDPEAMVVLCDSYKGGEYDSGLNCNIVSNKEAVESYRENTFIVSIQDKRAVLDAVIFLLEQGIGKKQILLYDKMINWIM